MKNAGLIFFVLLFLLSCHAGSKKGTLEHVSVKKLTKLEHLFLLPSDSVINAYDLSNDSIVSFPIYLLILLKHLIYLVIYWIQLFHIFCLKSWRY